jgi:hypothetical protein
LDEWSRKKQKKKWSTGKLGEYIFGVRRLYFLFKRKNGILMRLRAKKFSEEEHL